MDLILIFTVSVPLILIIACLTAIHYRLKEMVILLTSISRQQK